MAIEDIKLRSVSNPPLTTKGSRLTWAELDVNFVQIYNALKAQYISSYVPAYDNSKLYDDSVNNYSQYNSAIWKWINPSPGTNVTPGTDPSSWTRVFAADLSHQKDHDTFLDYGGDNQVSAQELKEIVDPDRVIQYLILADNGSPQHKWKLQVDSTGALYTEDLGAI